MKPLLQHGIIFIHMTPPTALSVLVSPVRQVVGEGAVTSFECLVVGNPVSDIQWARDFKDLEPGKVYDTVPTCS